jgi:hypothetical protein
MPDTLAAAVLPGHLDCLHTMLSRALPTPWNGECARDAAVLSTIRRYANPAVATQA